MEGFMKPLPNWVEAFNNAEADKAKLILANEAQTTQLLKASNYIEDMKKHFHKMVDIVEGKWESNEATLFHEELEDYLNACRFLNRRPVRGMVDEYEKLDF